MLDKKLLYIFLFLQLISGSPTIYAGLNPYIYFVKNIEGEVRYRPRLGTHWKILKKNEILRPGTIIEVKDKSTITLGFQNQIRGELRGTETTITFEVPLMIRLDNELLKKNDIVLYHYNDAALVKNDSYEVTDKSLFQRMWQWIIVELPRTLEFLEDTKYTQTRQRVKNNITVRHRTIQIFYPRNDSEIFAKSFPHRIKVKWEQIKAPNRKYQFFIWKAGEPTPRNPRFITRFNESYINIPEPGSYYLMIKSLGEHYRSTAQLVHILPYSELSSYKLSGKLNKDESKDNIIIGPLPEQMLITREKKGNVAFSIDYSKNIEFDQWWIEVRSSSKENTRYCLRERDFCNVLLPPGLHSWRGVIVNEQKRTYQEWQTMKIYDFANFSHVFKEGLNKDFQQNVTIID